MEVATTATTNNHNQSRHHHSAHFHHPEQQRMPSHHPHNTLSVGLTTNGTGSGGARSPFQREVREWQHIDPDTGALLTGRLEADRWINGPMNSYGKISDSQNISQPNGTQHTQRKQLEVLQARTATGAMQVIRAQTVQKTSSRWSSSTSVTTSASTSASSSAVASPTIMGALTTNGNSSFNNHLRHSHFPSSQSRYGLPKAPCLPQKSILDICEVSHSHSSDSRTSSEADADDNNADADADADVDVDDDDDVTSNMINAGNAISGSNHFFNRHSFLNNDHNNVIGNRNLSLLLDTAPSLKLSNLMKSNSSLSSNNSSSNNSTTTSTMSDTHYQKIGAGKISLHAIVGNGESKGRNTLTTAPTPSLSLSSSTPSSSSSSSSLKATATCWQQQQRSSRLFDQPTLYGNSNQCQSLTKSRVGVKDIGTGDDVVISAAAAPAAAATDDGADGDSTTPTQQISRQQRHDLESFRHYNEHGSTSASTLTSASVASLPANAINTDDDDDDDDVLRLNKRHQRRQQLPISDATTTLYRSRSISTDDLSTEWDKHTEHDGDEAPGEWRRVSKLRRSFQSSSSGKSESSSQPRRPIDLPSNSVSVARIRAELENGRRLNTAMRNNNVDLAALDTILNGSPEATKPVSTKRNSFLTAESLKEIRAGLKKLSDESLYRDDYIPATHNDAPDDHIEIQDIKKPPERIRLRQLTPEKSKEITPPKSAFKVFARPVPTLVSPTSNFITQQSLPTGASPKHTTHSLESRQKNRDSIASIEWHLRRKSYGFEKMSPPDDKSMFRMDASTDSGLGRSGEQLGNWSPTEPSATNTRTTVIHFGETSKVINDTNKPLVQKRFRQLKSPESVEGDSTLKRHSIAVDESQYVRENGRKTSQVLINGYHNSINDTAGMSLQPTRFQESNQEATANLVSSASSLLQRSSTQQKRVEFCKTEVHFAAESGRVNIVETDGKPPPTNNFRRRRRTTSGPLQTLMKSASVISDTTISNINNVTRPITHFGDTSEAKTVTSTTVAYKASLSEHLPENESANTNVTFSTPKMIGSTFTQTSGSRSSYTSTSGIDTTDGETDEISTIRGILKNKPIKPKPYHLGDNIESTDALWGVQLKPVNGNVKHEMTKSTSPPLMASTSVAERVRIVEQRQDNAGLSQTNGYSTKINLSLSDDPKVWSDTGAAFITDNTYDSDTKHPYIHQRRPSLQELMLQGLREHQRILDEGLKSTSLIIKTMRSANEFDEAMRRLSIASAEAAIIPQIVIPTPMMRSHSYQGSSRRISTTSFESSEVGITKSSSSTSNSMITIRRSSTDAATSVIVAPPVATPRLKLLGNTEIPVSQQLTQLRRLYDLAATSNGTSQDEDSADEEVKRYFNEHQYQENSDSGGGTQESSSLEDERFIEYSNSWNRLKAKRTIWRIGSYESNKQTRTLERTELPKSNVMSIELHSPQTSLERPDKMKLIDKTPPVAKPRITTIVQNTEKPYVHTATTVTQCTETGKSRESNSDFLKIVKETRGARKLREHELSYFGVQPPKDPKMDTNPSIQSTSLKRNLPQRKTNDDYPKSSPQSELISETTKQQMATKWQLLNDKPDLLRHSPITVEPQLITRTAEIKPMERKSLKQSSKHNNKNDEHIYENIATEIQPIFKVKSPNRIVSESYDDPSSYDRKMDLKRDVMILNEMTENADQTLKAISDEAAIKDQRRRSLHRRHSKPLETIDEKTITEKINDKCIAVQVTRSTLASEAKRSSRHISHSPAKVTSRARSSSLSSNEGRPHARSRSLSSEREYENIKVRPKRISTSATRSRATKLSSRSSSRESQHAHLCSSGEDDTHRHSERLRNSNSRSKHTSSKDVRKSGSRDSARHHDKMQHSPATVEKPQRRDDEHKKRTSSSTAHSSRRERVECNDEVKTQNSHHHHHHHHNDKPNDKSHHRSLESSHSRRRKEDQKLVASSRKSTDEKRGTEKTRTSTHGSGSHRHESAHHHLSSHRDAERDCGREKSSRTKGHSSRSNHQKSELIGDTNHEKHGLSPTKNREHRKSATSSKHHGSTDGKQQDPVKSTTHSKNVLLINEQNQQQHSHHQNGNHDNHHVHSMTTATIAAKQRESRSGRDRK